MPGLNGFAACRRLKASATTRDIPVIFMTALADTDSKIAGFAAGGVDYVTKPFETAEVLARVNAHLTVAAMRSRLAAQNLQLQHEIAERQHIEEELRLLNIELEDRVCERTVRTGSVQPPPPGDQSRASHRQGGGRTRQRRQEPVSGRRQSRPSPAARRHEPAARLSAPASARGAGAGDRGAASDPRWTS